MSNNLRYFCSPTSYILDFWERECTIASVCKIQKNPKKIKDPVEESHHMSCNIVQNQCRLLHFTSFQEWKL